MLIAHVLYSVDFDATLVRKLLLLIGTYLSEQ